MRRILATIALGTVLGAPSMARAQPRNEDLARADALFNAAKALLDGGQYADACAKFAESKRLAPGLGVTLDPSHYIGGQHPRAEYDVLYPHVRHVRLRDTTPDRPQVRIGQGQIEYGKIVTLLERENYTRALTVDIRDVPQNDYPIEPEVRKLKFLLESMV